MASGAGLEVPGPEFPVSDSKSGKRPKEVIDQLERRCWSDMLREVVAPRNEDTVYLFPVGPHRVAGGH